MRTPFLIGGIAAGLLVVLVLNYWSVLFSGDGQSETLLSDPVVAQSTVESEPEDAEVPTPVDTASDETPTQPSRFSVAGIALGDSDTQVREVLAGWRLPADWLAQEDLVRRASVVIENASRGELPRRQLGWLAPEGAFPVLRDETGLYVDPAGYARFDQIVRWITSVPPADAAEMLIGWADWVAEALGELGVTNTPRETVLAAMDEVDGVPVLREPVALERPKVMYVYKNPALEALSPLQKQLLRMGPGNVEKLKAYVQAVRAAMLQGAD